LTKRSTISDVAEKAGVSISTVSRVLNNSVPVQESIAQRVRKAVSELNYVPHSAARTLASNRTNTLGLILHDIGGEFYTPLLRGVEGEAGRNGYDLLIYSSDTAHTGDLPRHTLGEHNTDGILVFTNALDSAELARLHEIGFPVILLNQTPPKKMNIPMITIENQSGAEIMVDHLIDVHRRKRIAFVQGPPGNEDSELREKGYRLSLSKHKIPFFPDLICRGNYEPDQAYEAVKQLISKNTKLDGFFTGDDGNAIGVIQALQETGLDIPGDVSVAGFDDSIFARILNPPLTTVRAPVEEIGRKAVEMLIRLIHGEIVEKRIVLPTEMIIRQSCGCQP
jgi:LacI family transcriptional regulator